MTTNQDINTNRSMFILVVMLGAVAVLMYRLFDLHVLESEFLQMKGDAISLREVEVLNHRGMIRDRNGNPLAISTPVDSVWINPEEFTATKNQLIELARLLELSNSFLESIVFKRKGRQFTYVKRRINPTIAKQVKELEIAGLYLQREYRRYYPLGEISAHLMGFTNVDDKGQEGLELAFNNVLQGIPGRKRIMKDRLGRVVKDVENMRTSVPGKDITLSIDRRVQYIAYKELMTAVVKHKAKSGSVIILDINSGEVLAMVNQPGFNPNNRYDLHGPKYRNRAVTDVFEPGSTIKPFLIAAALESGQYKPDTEIDTSPGLFKVGKKTIKDSKNFGRLDVTNIITKSSNVGVSKIALALKPKHIWNMFSRAGFGVSTGSRFPGESQGVFNSYTQWNEIETATLAYGYGMSVTALQLVRAYAAVAGDGMLRPVSIVKNDNIENVNKSAIRILDQAIAVQIRNMLETVVEEGGTGSNAGVLGYRVAGKTGTVKRAGIGGYLSDHYSSLFVGVIPASNPKLAMVVVVNEPSDGNYYGGKVAAPVFSKVMTRTLRLLNITPDSPGSDYIRIAELNGNR